MRQVVPTFSSHYSVREKREKDASCKVVPMSFWKHPWGAGGAGVSCPGMREGDASESDRRLSLGNAR